MRRLSLPRRRAPFLCGLALVSGLAHAASITDCTVSVSGVVFGTYTPLAATALLSNGSVNIACTGIKGNNGVTIDLSPGSSGAYIPTRTLTSGTLSLNYNLYVDAGYSQVWGNGSGGSVEGSVSIRKHSPNATLTIYGAVAARQDPAPGVYSDSIIVSVNY
jgi:spore coat protein U-like protein